MYNKVILVGNLTRDVEIRYSQTGTAFAKVGIATNRKSKTQTGEQKDEVMFIDLTFWGRTAEIANQYLRKGSKVLVEARLVLEQWIAQDGTKRSKHALTVDNLTMLDTKAEAQNPNHDNGQWSQPSQNQSQYSQPQQQQQQSYGGQQQSNQNSYPEQQPASQNNYVRQQHPNQNSYGGANTSGYNNPPQQEQNYTQPPQQQQQQQQGGGYNNQPQASEQPAYQQAPQQQKQQSVPEINIDEDEIPF